MNIVCYYGRNLVIKYISFVFRVIFIFENGGVGDILLGVVYIFVLWERLEILFLK